MESYPPLGKNKAIIAYITFVGMLIAYFMNRDEKHEFATYHIKNMFGLVLLLFISQVTQANIHLLAGEILWLFSSIFWLYSLLMAFDNKKKGIPWLSEKFQEWFTFLN
ncbi:MAG: hypothetical protein IIB06_02710 [Bacteroidetes bacterium]|nr:hypothetical protein [Bacteroidota bacterium]